ncbi:hypothetical protein BLNAU_2981 [Blattamonas nauphoetae]|uniref:Uncharacterized protein n=1 Tax=Blattamonas nauphoetae TaxID=2049346 RepID=A0ABQ9YE05_9EUKA|nr:hypothetical protein BLNAU_2981 [Blattamonas nauphoetae]
MSPLEALLKIEQKRMVMPGVIQSITGLSTKALCRARQMGGREWLLNAALLNYMESNIEKSQFNDIKLSSNWAYKAYRLAIQASLPVAVTAAFNPAVVKKAFANCGVAPLSLERLVKKMAVGNEGEQTVSNPKSPTFADASFSGIAPIVQIGKLLTSKESVEELEKKECRGQIQKKTDHRRSIDGVKLRNKKVVPLSPQKAALNKNEVNRMKARPVKKPSNKPASRQTSPRSNNGTKCIEGRSLHSGKIRL